MTIDPKFDDIRPYYDEEVPAAMQRIAKTGFFALLSDYIFPGVPVEDVRKMISGLKTTEEFQKKVMYLVNRRVIETSMTEFSCDGLENIDPSMRYLFVSNHRDIMLDASLLENVLVDNGHDTSEITFGANLMSSPLVIDIGKSNKMFRVERDAVNPRDFLKSSLHLSEYIRFAITQKNQSVWIAQRNGRTKDGIDQTAPGIIKMFQMSYPEDRIAALEQLHIVPVTVSYEWEPCDIHKTLELYESGFGVYTKMPQEDLNSILSGIVAPKGRVHFHIGKMIQREDLLPFNNQVNSKFNRDVAELLDRRICSEYRLTPNNYIAHDLLYGQSIYRDMYTVEQKDTFMQRLASFEKYENCNHDRMREIFLGIYANPVDSYIKAKAQIAEE